MTRFGGESIVPGIQAERATVEAQLYFGRIEQQYFQGGILEAATADPGHGTQTSQLRPGLILAQIRSTGLLTEWDPWSTVAGVNTISGFLNHHIDMELDGVTQNRYSNLIMYGGNIKSDSIIVPSSLLNDPGEFDGNEFEFMIRDQLKHRFIFDDDIYGEITAPKYFVDVTAATTLLDIDTNTHWSNAETITACALTLPDAKPGMHFTVDQVGTNANGEIITVDNVSAANANFMDELLDDADDVVLAATEFTRTSFDAILYDNATVDLYKYMVSRHL